jgi:putative DNA primase/helicase
MTNKNPRRDAITAGAVGKLGHSKFTSPSPAFQAHSAIAASANRKPTDAAKSNSHLDWALAYARRGWRIFPLHSIRDGRCTCGRDCGKSAGKHPRVKGGFKVATTDAQQIEAWWIKWPDASIGIATGAASGLIVIDIDGEQGLATLKALVDQHGFLPRTAIVKTARGWHLYFAMPATCARIPCSTGNGLDVRGDGGYVVAPPSIHLSGHVYTWHYRG